jgi:hypothetical protein
LSPPSRLRGFGFSGKPTQPGCGTDRIAGGYSRYGSGYAIEQSTRPQSLGYGLVSAKRAHGGHGIGVPPPA